MINKTIHYCWFGNKRKGHLEKKCIKSWKKYAPDFFIKEWNDDNCDISQMPDYVKEAYSNKKWAFVTDYLRLQIVYKYGGVYLDTDVEMIKPIDPLLNYSSFFGFEKGPDGKDYCIATGLGFGATQNNKLLSALMKDYKNVHFIGPDGKYDLTPCPKRNRHVFEEFGVKMTNVFQNVEGCVFLPSDYLCPKYPVVSKEGFVNWKTEITNNTYCIHHFRGSWVKKNNIFKKIKLLFYYIKCKLKRNEGDNNG